MEQERSGDRLFRDATDVSMRLSKEAYGFQGSLKVVIVNFSKVKCLSHSRTASDSTWIIPGHRSDRPKLGALCDCQAPRPQALQPK